MVLIAIPTTGNVRYTLVQQLLKYDKRDDVEIYFSKASPVDVNRVEIAQYFMEETDHEYLLMVDDDIVPPEDVLDMLEYDKDIISALVFSTQEGIPYPVATVYEHDGKMHMAGGTDEELLEVDGVGTGCIAIKRNVFEEMDEPWFQFKKNDDGTMNTGEDLDFCVRAGDAGFNIHVAMDYPCGHLATMNLEQVMRIFNIALDTNKSNIHVEEV